MAAYKEKHLECF